jgi:hypothetical protein
MAQLGTACGATYEMANGETITPCHKYKGHEGVHEGYCLGSKCVWAQGTTSEYEDYVARMQSKKNLLKSPHD